MKTLDDYQRLAALIAATKGIDSRRLQKLVFVLEALDAPFRYQFRMHFDEPYSEGLEADVNLLTTLGFITQEEGSKRESTMLRPNRASTDYLDAADELKPFLSAIADLTTADSQVLAFATMFGAWREFKYNPRDALEQTLRNTPDRKIDAEGERFLKRLGLLAKG